MPMKTSLRRRAFLAPLTLLGVGHWLTSGARAAEDQAPRRSPNDGAFSAAASEALEAMTRRAKELGVQGVAVVAYAEGERVTSWSSKMVVVGSMKNAPTEESQGANLLGIAYAKAAEMADTLKDSGTAGRPPMTGEFGWQGGVIARAKTGYVLAAFSGGPSEDDVRISRAGLQVLVDRL
jgi:uncharacterized protein GlcG (DUF336 family)